MSAVLTQFNQGQVGSCFATAPCRNLHDSKPEVYVQHLTQMVTTGELNLPNGGTRMPVVTKVPPVENALQGTYQYTVATMGSRVANSYEKEKLSKVLFGTAGGQ